MRQLPFHYALRNLGMTYLETSGLERGWPHFVLRLSAGGFDVEVDLNPYVPDEPFDLDEVQRQAEVILQVAGSV